MDFLVDQFLGKPIWMWGVFLSIVVGLLVLDLGVLHRKPKAIGVKESLWMSAFYITAGLLFGLWVWHSLGSQSATEYVTGFLVEKTLALDNIFVISLIFTYFAIPAHLQHRVLFWGILGVIVLRAIMIGFGAALVSEFSWVLYLFAAFLIFTGIKMLLMTDHGFDVEASPVMGVLRRFVRVTPKLEGDKFFVKRPDPATGKTITWATPLFAALVMIEFVDLIFAVDSVPAIFAITTDPFIVYTSNIFAILGLRALFFALAAVIERFQYLKQALALVLIFIGSKVFLADIMGTDKFPAWLSLTITVGLLAGGIIYSLWKTSGSPPPSVGPASKKTASA